MTTNTRVEQFKAEAADMNLKAGNASRESQLQVLGVVLMLVGIIGAFLAYVSSTGVDAAADVMEMVALAVAFLTVAVVGAVVFLRYSLGKFLRLWLLRQLYEGQSHIDQVVGAIGAKQ